VRLFSRPSLFHGRRKSSNTEGGLQNMCQGGRLLWGSYVVKRCYRRQGELSERTQASDCAKLLYLCTNDRVLHNIRIR
jgi:hypothetical protein